MRRETNENVGHREKLRASEERSHQIPSEYIDMYSSFLKRLSQECFCITLTRESERKCRSPKKN